MLGSYSLCRNRFVDLEMETSSTVASSLSDLTGQE